MEKEKSIVEKEVKQETQAENKQRKAEEKMVVKSESKSKTSKKTTAKKETTRKKAVEKKAQSPKEKIYKLNSKRGLQQKIDLVKDFLSKNTAMVDNNGDTSPFAGHIVQSEDDNVLFYISSLFDNQVYPVYNSGTLTVAENTLTIESTYSPESANASITRKYIFSHPEQLFLNDWAGKIKRWALYSLYQKADLLSLEEKESPDSKSKKADNVIDFQEKTAKELQTAFNLEEIKQTRQYDVDVPEFSCTLAPTSDSKVVLPIKETEKSMYFKLNPFTVYNEKEEARAFLIDFFKKAISEAKVVGFVSGTVQSDSKKDVELEISDSKSVLPIDSFHKIQLIPQDQDFKVFDKTYSVRFDIHIKDGEAGFYAVIVDKDTLKIYTPYELKESFTAEYIQHIRDTQENKLLDEAYEDMTGDSIDEIEDDSSDLLSSNDNEILFFMIGLLIVFVVGIFMF